MAPRNNLRLLASVASFVLASARIHTLTIDKDPRFVFSIESFGFLAGGTVRLDLTNVKVSPSPDAGGPAHILGFVIMPNLQTESTINEYIAMLDREKVCAMDAAPSSALVVNVSDPSVWAQYSVPAEVTGPGMYDLLFTHCSPTAATMPAGSTAPVTVSFQLEATFQNPDGSYLSAGDMPLPGLYGTMTVLFAAACGVWVWWLRKNRTDTYKLHHLMTLLVAVKAFQVLTEAVMYHYISVTGHNSAWNVMFYIFTLLKGLIMVRDGEGEIDRLTPLPSPQRPPTHLPPLSPPSSLPFRSS
jgi:G protein-coupled receptor 107